MISSTKKAKSIFRIRFENSLAEVHGTGSKCKYTCCQPNLPEPPDDLAVGLEAKVVGLEGDFKSWNGKEGKILGFDVPKRFEGDTEVFVEVDFTHWATAMSGGPLDIHAVPRRNLVRTYAEHAFDNLPSLAHAEWVGKHGQQPSAEGNSEARDPDTGELPHDDEGEN